MQYSESTKTAKTVWRFNTLRADNKIERRAAPDSGETSAANFGLVKAGTHMAKMTSAGAVTDRSGLYRPCGIAVIATADTSVNTVDVTDASGIFVGDVVGIYETKEEGTEGTQNATGRNVTAVDKTSTPNTVTFDGAAVAAVAVDEYLLVENAYITEGILDEDVDLSVLGTETAQVKDVTLAIEGHALTSKLVAHCPLNALIMQGGVIRSALLLALDATLLLGEYESTYAGIKLHS